MAQDVVLSMDGLLLNWLKDTGEQVSAGEVIAEVEADKATVEVEAPADGVLLELLAEVGDEMSEGDVIARVGEAGEAPSDGGGEEAAEPAAEAEPEDAPAEPAEATGAASDGEKAPTGNGVVAATTPEGRIKASPLARRIAEDRGIDLRQVAGSGPGGRIVKEDVENFKPSAKPAAAPSAPAARDTGIGQRQTYGKLPQGDDVEIIDITRMRRAIADGTILSKQMTPHFYVTVDIDVEPLLALRKQLNASLEAEGIKISVNDMIVKATALTLKQFPNLNSHYYGDKIVRHKRINVGIAVALPDGGLINVVAKDVDKSALSVLAQQNKDMFARAREGRVKPEDMRGATFTVSNLGPYDVDHFQAIINPPEAGIIAVGSAKKVPIVKEDGSLGVGNRMKVTISVDHRVSDGAEGAEWLRTFRDLLEHPMRLLV